VGNGGTGLLFKMAEPWLDSSEPLFVRLEPPIGLGPLFELVLGVWAGWCDVKGVRERLEDPLVTFPRVRGESKFCVRSQDGLAYPFS
jgi:hypothetical protein